MHDHGLVDALWDLSRLDWLRRSTVTELHPIITHNELCMVKP